MIRGSGELSWASMILTDRFELIMKFDDAYAYKRVWSEWDLEVEVVSGMLVHSVFILLLILHFEHNTPSRDIGKLHISNKKFGYAELEWL